MAQFEKLKNAEDPYQKDESGTSSISNSASEASQISTCALYGWNAVHFVQTFCFTSMTSIFILVEMKRLYPGNGAVMSAVTLSVGCAASLASPAVGALVDRNHTSFGKRRPVIVVGALLAAAGFLLAGCAAQVPEVGRPASGATGAVVIAGFGVSFVGLMFMVIGQNSLVYDAVPEHSRGKASGAAAAMKTLGSIVGMATVWALVRYPMHTWLYFLYVPIVLIGTAVLCCTVSEAPSDQDEEPSSFGFSDLVGAYKVDVHSSFWLVTLSRASYYAALAVQGYLIFYFRDTLQANDAQQKWMVVSTGVIGQASTAIIAPMAGAKSDKYGRKPLIYFASGVLVIVYAAFLLAPVVFSTEAWDGTPGISPALVAMWVTALVFGLGNGCWRAADYALAMDCLPNKMQASKDLCMWNLGLYFGLCFGNFCGGVLLNANQSRDDDSVEGRYTYIGYVIMLGFGSVMSVATGLIARQV